MQKKDPEQKDPHKRMPTHRTLSKGNCDCTERGRGITVTVTQLFTETIPGGCRASTMAKIRLGPAVLPPGEIIADATEKWLKLMGNGHVYMCQGTDLMQKISSGHPMKKE